MNKVLADATCVLFLIRNGIDIITQLCYSLAFLKQRYDFISIWNIWIKPFVMHDMKVLEDNCENLTIICHAFLRKVYLHSDEAHSCDTTAVLIAADTVYIV